MAARNYDLVEVNADAVKKDLERFGLDMKTLSKKMGKEEAFISSTLRRGRVTRSLVEGIEDALFAGRGKYTIELEKPIEKPTEPQEAKLSEGMGILLKQIVGAVNALSAKVDAIRIEPNTDKVIFRIDGFKAGQERKMDELIKAVKESNAANEVILQDILQKQKEMTTLAARILSNMERRQS